MVVLESVWRTGGIPFKQTSSILDRAFGARFVRDESSHARLLRFQKRFPKGRITAGFSPRLTPIAPLPSHSAAASSFEFASNGSTKWGALAWDSWMNLKRMECVVSLAIFVAMMGVGAPASAKPTRFEQSPMTASPHDDRYPWLDRIRAADARRVGPRADVA